MTAHNNHDQRVSLAQAIQEDSNHELDWLYFASMMTTAEEQRYCLERALHINPKSQSALRALRALDKQQPAAASATRRSSVGRFATSAIAGLLR
ncbi:MAG: hypothetical protein IPK19_06405 [Chloroflexi bacterium]|nr:hypothetical protein [Chloroflexota bacterium]